MQALARLEQLQAKSRRIGPRRKLSLGSSLTESGDQVVIHDLSAGGMLIQTSASLKKAERLEIDLPEVGATTARVVWSSGAFFGCEFEKPISRAALSAALLRNPFEPAEAPAADVTYDESEQPAAVDDDRAPFAVRMRVIMGSAVLLWTLVLLAFTLI